MSEEAQPAESSKDPLLSLNSLDLGPAWARGEPKHKGGAESESKRRQGNSRGRRTDRGDRRKKGDYDSKKRSGRRGDRKEEPGRRSDRGAGRQKFQRDRKGRRDEEGRGPRDREEVPAPEGFAAGIMPVEEGLDGLAKEIMAGGRTYSVFDLSKLVLGSRERFNVTFQSGQEGSGLIRCKKDGSLWLTREEAIRHFWQADWRRDFYEEVVSEAEPPKGNYQAVGRCGISGELLGPPNYHGYQTAVLRLHRERFGRMSLDAFKRKIKMEHGEEVVAAWMEKMAKRTAYRPTGGVVPDEEHPASMRTQEEDSDSSEVASVAEESQGVAEEDSDSEITASSSEADLPESDAKEEPGQATDAHEQPEPAPEVPVEQSSPCIEDPREVERHFGEHHFEEAFQETGRAWVGGNIRGNLLSPGLLTLLRHTVSEERRYPGKLTPILCRQLSGRHVAVFKWKRKLKAGPSRPHPVPEKVVIADRPLALLKWITTHSGRKLEHLWNDLLPQEISDKEKVGWYHDLHWLLNQGYILLMADSTIHRAKAESGEGAAQRGGPALDEKAAQGKKDKHRQNSRKEDPPVPLEETSEVQIADDPELPT